MNGISTFRLYVLRASYLLIAVGLGIDIWPGIVVHPPTLGLMASVVRAILGCVALLALLGLRYPLHMLPLLFFELLWKSIWLVAFAWPLWAAQRLDAAAAETVKACVMGIVIFPLAIPWPYVWRRFVRESGDRWTRAKEVA